MPPTVPENAAQEIASQYSVAWAAALPDVRLLYVEGFPDAGSVQRIQALPERASAVLVEEDPARVAHLRGLLKRLDREDVSVLEADITGAIPVLVERATEVGHALVHLHPPAPGKLPLDTVRVLAAVAGVDFWIRFPHEDLHKLTRFRGSTLADLPPYARRIVEGYSHLLDDPRQGWAAEWRREAIHPTGAAEQLVVEKFRDALLAVASSRALKLVELELTAGVSLRLFCMTSDPMRALALNSALEEAGLDAQVRWPEKRFRRILPAPPPLAEALDFFYGAGVSPPKPPVRELDEKLLADVIDSRFVGRMVPLGDVVRELLGTDVFPDDVRRALRLLRRDGRALYRSLKASDAEIAFPAVPLGPRARSQSVTGDILELLP